MRNITNIFADIIKGNQFPANVMESSTVDSGVKWKLDLLNASFLTGTPILAVVGMIWYTMTYGVTWKEPTILFVMYWATGLSITAGYHRLFSHRTHTAAWPLRLFYAIFAAGAYQNSAIKWCSDHRRHHLKVDTDVDPYSVTRGFFWAHMGWVMVQEGEEVVEKVEDLQADPILAWQARNIFKIGFVSGIIFPGFLGLWLLGGWVGFMGGLIWGGFLRLVLVHHGTFLINSGAHYWGSQPYSTKNTSRDFSPLSLVTFGEGYHNFHHTFQADYRNGHRWFHWDPSKWWITLFSIIGMTKALHKVPQWTIQSARMKTTFEKKEKALVEGAALTNFKKRSNDCSKRLRSALRDLANGRSDLATAKALSDNERKTLLKDAIKQSKQRVKDTWSEFNQLMSEMRTSKEITA